MHPNFTSFQTSGWCLGFTLSRQLCKEGSLVPGKDGPGRCKPNGNVVATCFQFQGKCKVQLFFNCGISNVTEDTKRYKQNMYMSFTPVASFLDFHPCKLKTTYTLYKNNFQLQFSRPLLKGKCHLSHFRHIYALSTWACLQFLSVLINLKHHTERLKHAKTSRGADRRECLPPCVVPPRCPRWFRGKWRQVMGWSVGNGWQWEPTSSGNSRDGWKKKQPRPVSRNGDLQHVTSN